MNFTELKQNRYSVRPWDFDWNPVGFRACGSNTSDISAHLPFLEFLALQCGSIVEFGVRDGFSTVALLSGCKGHLYSYDINTSDTVKALKQMKLPCKWTFTIADTSKLIDIPECDLLFIDTLHTYEQVKAELRYVDRVKKWIAFHDTFSQGAMSLDIPGQPGISEAINEFLNANQEWKVVYHVDFNHGLTVLGK